MNNPPVVEMTDEIKPVIIPPQPAFRPKKPKPMYARTRGAKNGRMEKPEDLFREAIRAGIVQVIRRKGKPPLIKWLKP